MKKLIIVIGLFSICIFRAWGIEVKGMLDYTEETPFILQGKESTIGRKIEVIFLNEVDKKLFKNKKIFILAIGDLQNEKLLLKKYEIILFDPLGVSK